MVAASKHPMIYWAQRKATLLLTIAVEDVKVENLEFKDNNFSFKGLDGSNQVYEVSLNFYDKVDPATLHKADTSRHLEMVIEKVEPNWWPRLLKDNTKMPWIKVDFNNLPAGFDPSSLGDLGDLGDDAEEDDIDTPTTSGVQDEADTTEVGA
ncbi:hypothetical protein FO519_006446 [Halicephalobus sp. NKZ332]|nr:hypothetical protein FO519_006446 [Halicephalobus sp. NKZ332]